MLSNSIRLLFITSLFVSGSDALGCRGGDTFNGGGDGCNLNSVTCDEESCLDMGGVWTDECPDPDPDCDPLAPSDVDPSCTGQPESIDRFGKKMYRRKIISSEKPQDSDEGVFCHVTLELCDGETSLTQGIDSGFGDYYRLGATAEWCDYKGTAEYSFDGMYKCTGARSYSHINPLNENTVQFIIKEETSDADDNDCTAGIDCKFGMSELMCFAPVGSEILVSANPDHAGVDDSTHYVYQPNFSREPGSGPYTFNFIGQGVALTELNPGSLNALLEPFASDGSFSTIKEINYLWANSYWSNAEWIFEDDTNSTDLARAFIREGLKYGIRLNLMHSISREQRPEAEWPRTNVDVIGEAFKLTNTTEQDPNIKWFVVGSSGYKKSLYPQILEWGFDLTPCSPAAARKGYPYCGTNALYEWELPGAVGLENRGRSVLYSTTADEPTKAPTNAPTVAPTPGLTTEGPGQGPIDVPTDVPTSSPTKSRKRSKRNKASKRKVSN